MLRIVTMSKTLVRYSGTHQEIFDFLKEKYKAESDSHVFRIALEIAFEHENETSCTHLDNTSDDNRFTDDQRDFNQDPVEEYAHEIMSRLRIGETLDVGGKEVRITEENMERVAMDFAAIELRKQVASSA